jgi:hypothetical protein
MDGRRCSWSTIYKWRRNAEAPKHSSAVDLKFLQLVRTHVKELQIQKLH